MILSCIERKREDSVSLHRAGVATMDDDLEKKIDELKRTEKRLDAVNRQIKEALLAGANVEPGARYVELRLLPGRDPESKNPDDYELVVSHVQ
jgi:hypothetical protein